MQDDLIITTTTEMCTNRGVNAVLAGLPKVGKTYAMRTLPGRPLIIDCENGQLCNQGIPLPAIQLRNWTDALKLRDGLLGSDKYAAFDCIGIDSISVLAEMHLAEEIKRVADPRQAFGNVARNVREWINDIKNVMDKHIIFISKTAPGDDGRMMPLMPGKILANELLFLMDEILFLRFVNDEEGNPQRVIQCHGCETYNAGDRSGQLDFYEPPDLGYIITKIQSGVTNHELQLQAQG